MAKSVQDYLFQLGQGENWIQVADLNSLTMDDLCHLGNGIEQFDYSSALALRLIKVLGKEGTQKRSLSLSGIDVAEKLESELNRQGSSLIKRLEVSAPGFINIEVSEQACDLVFQSLNTTERFQARVEREHNRDWYNSDDLKQKFLALIGFLREIQLASGPRPVHLSFSEFCLEPNCHQEIVSLKKLVLSLDSCLEDGCFSNLERLADNVYEYLASTAIFSKSEGATNTRLWLCDRILQYIS